jgi:hypothetical protein
VLLFVSLMLDGFVGVHSPARRSALLSPGRAGPNQEKIVEDYKPSVRARAAAAAAHTHTHTRACMLHQPRANDGAVRTTSVCACAQTLQLQVQMNMWAILVMLPFLMLPSISFLPGTGEFFPAVDFLTRAWRRRARVSGDLTDRPRDDAGNPAVIWEVCTPPTARSSARARSGADLCSLRSQLLLFSVCSALGQNFVRWLPLTPTPAHPLTRAPTDPHDSLPLQLARRDHRHHVCALRRPAGRSALRSQARCSRRPAAAAARASSSPCSCPSSSSTTACR